jgi:uracil-DNA glycosylase
MTKLVFCGQAPSRIGDGRPFSGPSGKRLAALLRLRDYEHLHASVGLVNLFSIPADRQEARGDGFDEVEARARAERLLEGWNSWHEETIVVCCGHQVYQAFTGERSQFFKGKRMGQVELWCFPHPSGASSYWNHRANVLQAANFLRRLLNRSGIAIAR